MTPIMLEAIIIQLMRAFGPSMVELIQKQYKETGTIANAPELDALIVKHANDIIKNGEDWLTTHTLG